MTVTLSRIPDRELPAARRAYPDADLLLEVERRLRRSGYLALRDVSCELHAGIARLRGRVPTYYLKQMAQALVSEIEGVRLVINQFAVIARAGRSPLGREREGTWGETESHALDRKHPSWEGPSPSTHPEGSWERCSS
jgi:osmotically-inducible protein OsmY